MPGDRKRCFWEYEYQLILDQSSQCTSIMSLQLLAFCVIPFEGYLRGSLLKQLMQDHMVVFVAVGFDFKEVIHTITLKLERIFS